MNRRFLWRAGVSMRLSVLLAGLVTALLAGGPTALSQQAGGSPLGAIGGYNPLAPGAPQTAAPAPVEPASGLYEGLPETNGVELVYALCSACHSIRLVTQQRVTEARWDYLLDWMVKEHSMPELPPEDRALVLAYLSRHYSATR